MNKLMQSIIFIVGALWISDSAESTVIQKPRLEEFASRSDLIDVVYITDMIYSEDENCGGIFKATRLSSGSEIFILVNVISDVRVSGYHFAMLRKAQNLKYPKEFNCLRRVENGYLAAVAFQSIYPFGDNVLVSEKDVTFNRLSLFEGFKFDPGVNPIKHYISTNYDVVGVVNFKHIANHICHFLYEKGSGGDDNKFHGLCSKLNGYLEGSLGSDLEKKGGNN
ncbi:hypothetical protein [Rheinheimera baltica]|jgi:hypothetical protein|uniref:hypothetical protein n=1 Tax=Rheinheimera baltica TaxID=67576 RepID=UPI000422E050|nr:hypothetical protein [Rheinheimera baltica]